MMSDEYYFSCGTKTDSGGPVLETFVYCSRAAAGVDDLEVGRIIESAQRRNAAHGITGVLVFSNDIFFHWVEGPPTKVQNLIASLHCDPRHHDMVPLDRSVERRERLYPSWQMERVRTEDIRPVLQDALGSAEDENSILALKRILEHLNSGSLVAL